MLPSLLTLLASAGPARADCSVVEAIPGTLGEDLADMTMNSGGRIYGAVGSLNRTVIPRIEAGSPLAVHFGSDGVFGAAGVPARSFSPDCSDGVPFARYDFDLYATHLSVAGRFGPVRLFYSASVVTSLLIGNNGTRTVGYGANLLFGTYYSLAAPVIGYREAGGLSLQRWSFDYVAGAGIDLPVFQGDIGYVGSRGVYGNFSHPFTRAFARGVVADRLSWVPLLASGVDSLAMGGMFTSAYGRRLDTTSTGDPAGVKDEGEPAPRWTAHTAQDNILGMLDLHVAAGVKPRLSVYEALVRVHVPADADDLVDEGQRVDQLSAVWVGLIQVPEARYLDVEGGSKLQAGARVGVDYADGLGWLTLAVAYNSEEILAAFPQSEGAWHLQLTLSGQSEPE